MQELEGIIRVCRLKVTNNRTGKNFMNSKND